MHYHEENVSNFNKHIVGSEQSNSSYWDGHNGENSALSHFVNKKKMQKGQQPNSRYGQGIMPKMNETRNNKQSVKPMGIWVKSENQLQKSVSPAPSLPADASPFESFDVLQ